MSEPLGRRERERLAVEWIDTGDKQSEEMGGEELLRLRLYVLFDQGWVPLQGGNIPTQVRREETKEIRLKLLDQVVEEILPLVRESLEKTDLSTWRQDYFLPKSPELFKKYAWLGPEMAEEY